MYTKVKIGKHFSSEFEDNKDLRQGYAISPLLLNVVLETAIRLSEVETQRNMLDKCSQIMAYDNDDYVVLMGRRLKDTEEVITSLVEQTNKTGLQIHEKKTQFMIV
jgi:hypothetical protein